MVAVPTALENSDVSKNEPKPATERVAVAVITCPGVTVAAIAWLKPMTPSAGLVSPTPLSVMSSAPR